MRCRTPLALMEQTVMLLVFVVAAVFCVRIFVSADQSSERSIQKDQAILTAKNTIEILKSKDSHGKDFAVSYDKNWKETKENAVYEMTVIYMESKSPFLWQAEVEIKDDHGNVLICLPAAGQKNGGDSQ